MDQMIYSRMEVARTRMVLSLPFIAACVMMLKLVEDKSVKTAETDGSAIFYNPDFINPLTMRQVMWLMAHEALHCVLLHHAREGKRDHELWNIAGDYAINLILDEVKQLEFINGCYIDFAYKGMSTEEIYNLLYRLSPQQQQKLKDNHKDAGSFRSAKQGKPKEGESEGSESDDGAGDVKAKEGQPKDGQIPSTQFSQDQETKWMIFTNQTRAIAEKMQQGFGSAGLERLIDKLDDSIVPWEQKLHIFAEKVSNEEYSWNRFNRRYISSGFYFPSMHSESLGFLVIAVDTSGSISPNDLNRFAAEINAIKRIYNCRIMVIYCDAEISQDSIQIFEEYDQVELKPRGLGGTDFRPPFEYVKKMQIEQDIACFIYFTDGYCFSYPEKEPEYPVMWIGTREFKPNFGEFVLLESV